MATKPPNLDDFEMDLFKKGYKLISEQELPQENEPMNHKRIYTNAKPLYNTFRFLGFQEEIIVRVKFRDNKHFSKRYILDK